MQGKKDQAAISLVLDLAKALERFSLPVVSGLGDALQVRHVPCGYFEHQRHVQFEGCVAEPLQTITATLPGSKWSRVLLRIKLQDAPSEVMKVYPLLKLTVFADDVTAFLEGRHGESPGVAEKVLKSMRREVAGGFPSCRSRTEEKKEQYR